MDAPVVRSSFRLACEVLMRALSSMRGPAFSVACAAVITFFVLLACWPGVHGFWGRDDFMQLASVRLVGSPWPLLFEDAYPPASGAVFRPLGFLSFWLWSSLFGVCYEAHAIADLLLHAGVSVALFSVLRGAAVPRVPAVLCSLLFALHPATVGTALWWSARFDLLALLFSLLSLRAALAYRHGARPGALLLALGLALAAMLSKEIGLTIVVTISALWLRWAWQEPGQRRRVSGAVASILLVVGVYFSWRWQVLGTPASGLTGAMPLGHALAKGLFEWIRQAAGYLSFGTRIGEARATVLALAFVVLVGIRFVVARHAGEGSGWLNVNLAICGVCFLFVPAVLQAPVAALNARPLSVDMSPIEAAMQSRLYYVALAGAAMLLASVLAVPWRAVAPRWRIAASLALLAGVIVFGAFSHKDARKFARRSMQISTTARAAVAAVHGMDLPVERCHVVFLAVDPPSEWSVFVSMDSVVKALSPDLGRIAHCYFHTTYPTWIHLVTAPRIVADAAPWAPLQVDGAVLPSRRIGGLEIVSVLPPARETVWNPATVRFLRFDGSRFEDVTAEVAAGEIPVRFE